MAWEDTEADLELWREQVLWGAVCCVQDDAGLAPHPLQSLLLLHSHMVPAVILSRLHHVQAASQSGTVATWTSRSPL